MKHSLGGDNWKKMDDNQWDFTLIFPKIKHLEYLFITSGKRKSKKKHFEGENLWYLHKKKMSGKRLLQRKQSLMLPHWKKEKENACDKNSFWHNRISPSLKNNCVCGCILHFVYLGVLCVIACVYTCLFVCLSVHIHVFTDYNSRGTYFHILQRKWTTLDNAQACSHRKKVLPLLLTHGYGLYHYSLRKLAKAFAYKENC